MALVLTVLAIAILLVVNEIWVRRIAKPNEFSRKFIHIIVGSFVAVWPFYLTWNQIIFLSLAFVVVIIFSKYLGIFTAIHSVQRPTYGELCFAAAVGIIAVVTHSKGVYAVAVLQMSLADGLAAVTGIRYGRGNTYKILGATKSVAGSATFFAVSLMLLSGFSTFSDITIAVPTMVGLATLATILENLGIYGLDNLLVPLLIALALNP